MGQEKLVGGPASAPGSAGPCVLVIGSAQTYQTICELCTEFREHIKHIEGAGISPDKLARIKGPGLIFLECPIREGTTDLLDKTDKNPASFYVLVHRYDLADAENTYLRRPKVFGYRSPEQLAHPEVRDEIRRLVGETVRRLLEAPQLARREIGWSLGEIPPQHYESRRLVSLYIGSMREFIVSLRFIIQDLNDKCKKWRYKNPYEKLTAVRQLDLWHAFHLGQLEEKNQRDFEKYKRDKSFRLFQEPPPRVITSSIVLFRGESGTGKSLIARLFHREALEEGRPFQEILCSGIPEALLESELFGAMQGAYTDRHFTSPGKILMAYGGVLFLDEIGDMSPPLQGKLLKFLDNSEITPVGWSLAEGIRVPVIILAATNANLEQKVRERAFRRDLLYRLQRYELTIPPLKDRLWDLERMVDFILQNPEINCDAEGKRYVRYVADEVLTQLRGRQFPGNFRQIESTLQAAIHRARLQGSDTILAEHLPAESE